MSKGKTCALAATIAMAATAASAFAGGGSFSTDIGDVTLATVDGDDVLVGEVLSEAPNPARCIRDRKVSMIRIPDEGPRRTLDTDRTSRKGVFAVKGDFSLEGVEFKLAVAESAFRQGGQLHTCLKHRETVDGIG